MLDEVGADLVLVHAASMLGRDQRVVTSTGRSSS